MSCGFCVGVFVNVLFSVVAAACKSERRCDSACHGGRMTAVAAAGIANRSRKRLERLWRSLLKPAGFCLFSFTSYYLLFLFGKPSGLSDWRCTGAGPQQGAASYLGQGRSDAAKEPLFKM